MALTANVVRAFFFDADNLWGWLQSLCTPAPGENAGYANARRALFRNGVLCVLGQMNADPGRLNMKFDSIASYVAANKFLDGLESIFLSLLNLVAVGNDQTRFSNGLALWKQFTNSTVNSSDLDSAVFLDIAGETLFILKLQQLQTLKTGGPNANIVSSSAGFAAAIAKLASDQIALPSAAPPPTASMDRAASAQSPGSNPAWHDAAMVVWDLIGLILDIMRTTELDLGAAALVTNDALELADDANDLYDDLTDESSSTQDVNTSSLDVTGSTPAVNSDGVPVSTDDDPPAEDPPAEPPAEEPPAEPPAEDPPAEPPAEDPPAEPPAEEPPAEPPAEDPPAEPPAEEPPAEPPADDPPERGDEPDEGDREADEEGDREGGERETALRGIAAAEGLAPNASRTRPSAEALLIQRERIHGS